MSIFGLFQNRAWNSFTAMPSAAQQDVAVLLALDALMKSSIATELSRQPNTMLGARAPNDAISLFVDSWHANAALIGELQIGLLTTGIGKVLDTIKWSLLPPERAIECLGLLAMCQFRYMDKPDGQTTLQHSGYSTDPDEARTQYLVLAANTIGFADFASLSKYADETFRRTWGRLRKDIFDVNPRSLSNGSIGNAEAKAAFLKFSPTRQQLVLTLGESLAKNQQAAAPAAAKKSEPFNLVKHQQEHPLLYVPFPKMIGLMQRVESDINSAFRKLQIPDYELRRMVGAKDQLPRPLLESFAAGDAKILAFAIVSAAAGAIEAKFASCGVWKKMAESFQRHAMVDLHLMVHAQATGMLGDTKGAASPANVGDTSLTINQLDVCRKAAGNYLRAPAATRQEQLHLLFAGTIVLRHVLNHPSFGKPLAAFALGLLASLDPEIDQLTRGELLSWDQQKDLPL